MLEDFRLIDMYEEAIFHHLPLPERQGNWVQKFRSTDDGSTFVGSQFYRYQEVERFIRENFESGSPVMNKGGEP